jgi:hypothetical protein
MAKLRWERGGVACRGLESRDTLDDEEDSHDEVEIGERVRSKLMRDEHSSWRLSYAHA